MGLENRAVAVLRFDSGQAIATWTSFSLRDSYTDPLGSYQFTIALLPHDPKRDAYAAALVKGARLALELNGHRQATLLVQRLTRTYGRDGTSYALECKTPICTPYEGSVDPEISKRFTAATPVEDVILEALAPYGFDTIVSDVSAHVQVLTGMSIGGRAPDVLVEALKMKDVETTDGESAYEFPSRLFGRLGVALRCRYDGVLMLSAPDYQQAPSYTLTEGVALPAADRMLEPFEISESNEGCVSEVVVRGGAAAQTGKSSTAKPLVRAVFSGDTAAATVPFAAVPKVEITRTRSAYSCASAPFKPAYVTDKVSTDLKSATHRARLIHGRRAERGFELRCSVDGLVARSGAIWQVDTVAYVVSKCARLDEHMWISEVTRKADRQGGQVTELVLLPLGALVLGDVPG